MMNTNNDGIYNYQLNANDPRIRRFYDHHWNKTQLPLPSTNRTLTAAQRVLAKTLGRKLFVAKTEARRCNSDTATLKVSHASNRPANEVDLYVPPAQFEDALAVLQSLAAEQGGTVTLEEVAFSDGDDVAPGCAYAIQVQAWKVAGLVVPVSEDASDNAKSVTPKSRGYDSLGSELSRQFLEASRKWNEGIQKLGQK